MKTYYRVAITDGCLIDDSGRYLRDVIARDCGHNHRTEDTAVRCKDKLLNWSKDGRTCSTTWYSARILRTDANGKHVPYQDFE